jgi:hypothetical protein
MSGASLLFLNHPYRDECWRDVTEKGKLGKYVVRAKRSAHPEPLGPHTERIGKED